MLLQPLRWCCVDCVIHHERDVREEQRHRYMWREQAITEWSRHVNSIVACCHGAKLCAYAARDFRSHHYLYTFVGKSSIHQLWSLSFPLFIPVTTVYPKQWQTSLSLSCLIFKIINVIYQVFSWIRVSFLLKLQGELNTALLTSPSTTPCELSWMPASYTSGKPFHSHRHPTCWASSQWSHTVSSTLSHGA